MMRSVAFLLLVGACTYTSIVTPKSEPTSVGTSAEYTVYVGCGLRQSVFDLDGSLWVPVGVSSEDMSRTPAGFEAPDDTGMLTLVARNRAEFLSSQGRLIVLDRHEGNLEIDGRCD